MWYNEDRNLLSSESAVTLSEQVNNLLWRLSTMNTLPPHAQEGNTSKKLPLYDGKMSNRALSRINQTGHTGAHHQEDATVIYGMIDPRDRSIFYIGLTNNLYTRFKQHMLMSDGNMHKRERIQAILDAHMLPWMITLEIVANDTSPRDREIFHIQAYVQAGAILLNDELISSTEPASEGK